MAQWEKALVAKTDELSFIPRTHVVGAKNYIL